MADDKNSTTQGEDGTSRRGLLKAATIAIGGAMGAAISLPLLRYLFYPVGRKVVSTPDAPIDIGAADGFKPGQEPVKVKIVASSVRDAWGAVENVAVGSAWLARKESGEFSCFSSVCPHLGCAIDYSTEDKEYKCPCHKSAFGLDGEKKSGPSKRGLDPLQVKVEDGRVKVTYQRFRADVADREPV
jgi:Rieske Fe-S protein